MRFVFISLLAIAAALATLANAGVFLVVFPNTELQSISFTAVVTAIIISNLSAMIGIIGLEKISSNRDQIKSQNKPIKKSLASIIHLSGLLVYVGFPLGYLFGPLLLWIITRSKSLELDLHGQKAVNFALTMGIFLTSAFILIFLFVGVILVALLMFFHIFVLVRNGWLAYQGKPSRYPFVINFLN